MTIAGVDFEATSDDPTSARITEIGAILWDSDGWVEKERYSCLVYDKSYPKQSDIVVTVTGITDEMLRAEGRDPKDSIMGLLHFIGKAEKVIAHNKDYDRVLLESEQERHGISERIPVENWLCSYKEVPYPEHFRCKKLAHLLLDHGVAVDPANLHRAVHDVDLIAQVLRAGGYSLESILEYVNTPWVYLKALVKKPWEDNGVSTTLAKKDGYSWQSHPSWEEGVEFPKLWVKRVKANKLEAEKAKNPGFQRVIVHPNTR